MAPTASLGTRILDGEGKLDRERSSIGSSTGADNHSLLHMRIPLETIERLFEGNVSARKTKRENHVRSQ